MTGRASYDFAGKTILITGGAGDIGRATAQRFAADGAGVVILDLNEAKMAEVAHELEAYKIPVATFGCNVTDPDDVAQAFYGAVEQFGRIDYIFNNTGYQGVFAKTDEYPEEDFQKVIDQEIGIQAPSSVDGFSWFLIYSFKTSKGAPPTETAK